MFLEGMVVELPKRRERVPKNLRGRTRLVNHLHGRDNEMGRAREDLELQVD